MQLGTGLLILAAAAILCLLFARSSVKASPRDLYTLKGGETIAIRSLAANTYLELDAKSGLVYATAATADKPSSRWSVLVLDTATVAALARSAREIDTRSGRFTGRRMVTFSGCQCSGFSNAHGFGRFCHPWEDSNQEAWCCMPRSGRRLQSACVQILTHTYVGACDALHRCGKQLQQRVIAGLVWSSVRVLRPSRVLARARP